MAEVRTGSKNIFKKASFGFIHIINSLKTPQTLTYWYKGEKSQE